MSTIPPKLVCVPKELTFAVLPSTRLNRVSISLSFVKMLTNIGVPSPNELTPVPAPSKNVTSNVITGSMMVGFEFTLYLT